MTINDRLQELINVATIAQAKEGRERLDEMEKIDEVVSGLWDELLPRHNGFGNATLPTIGSEVEA